MDRKKVLFTLITAVFLTLSFNVASARNIRISTPYICSIRNVYEYISKRWVLFYRFKFMETSAGSDTYHIGGVALLF